MLCCRYRVILDHAAAFQGKLTNACAKVTANVLRVLLLSRTVRATPQEDATDDAYLLIGCESTVAGTRHLAADLGNAGLKGGRTSVYLAWKAAEVAT